MGDTTPSSGTTRNLINSIVGYLTGEAKKPEQTDSGYAIWITENHKVKSWLIDSMSPTLMQRFIRFSITKEIQEAVAKEIDHRTNTQDGSVEEADYGDAQLIHESSAMAVHHSSSVKGQTNQSFSRPTNLICSHCGESGHLKQRCYKIIGYPDWLEFSKKPRKVTPNRVVVTTSSGTNHPNNDGKIEPHVNFAQPGITDNNNVNVNVTAPSTNSTWIIDSGAYDHMTKDPITIIKTIFSALYFYR
ncbi:hypothetical protein KY290_035981 [Solanum tuberosum]|uniref:CCHC-type domain-containing protein n=1 Tax=Solanum tuberosum TaxID=4113 RepID=A0ABQ7TRG5_SOLTU|nr:hypothetical protein KY290_035981 [Solanum tuberosum]